MNEVRLDKWLWAARFHKTRSAATAACQAGKVKLNGKSSKPGRMVKIGDHLAATRKDYRQEVRITGLAERRASAKLAAELYEDVTPPEELERMKQMKDMTSAFHRSAPRTTGRPTKRDRRMINRLKERF